MDAKRVYVATVLPGLEAAVSDEAAAKLSDSAIVGVYRGKVLFSTALPLQEITKLRTADNIYILIDRFRVGPHKADLADVRQTLARMDLDSFVKPIVAPGQEVTFVVNASRRGKHTYSRFDAAAAAEEGICARYPDWVRGTPEHHLCEFRLDIEHTEALLSLRVTSATFRFRGKQRAFAKAALRPTVAHGLVWISKPEETDCFLDPCCGSGTIVSERLYYPARKVLGGDISAEAIRAAQENVGADTSVFQQWDARRLPIDAGSVNKIVTNLPFGRQILPDADLYTLYTEMVTEFRRVLSADGSAFVLTERTDILHRSADRAGLRYEEVTSLSLKGLLPKLVKLTTEQ